MRLSSPTRVLFVALIALLAVLVGPFPASAESSSFVVVVNPSNPNRTLSRRFVRDAFLKKTTRWPNGEVIRPVDLTPESSVRERFSQDILNRSTAEVKSYWQQVIFSGRDAPPPELPDDDAVLKFVARHPNAIGYVSSGARLGDLRPVPID